MTINSETRVAGPFEGNDSTVAFPFTFKVFDSDELYVVRATNAVETVLELGTDFTVTLNPDQNSAPGGTVTTVAPLATGSTLTLTSDLEALQPTDLTNQGGFYPRVINDALDRLTILVQQLKAVVSRTLKFPLSDGPVGDLPGRAARKGRVLAFHETTGEPMAGPSITYMDTVSGALEAIGKVADSIEDVNTVADNLEDVTNFADVYYGPSSTDPTTRRDGTALQIGDLYFNTVSARLRVYGGSAWNETTGGSVFLQNFSGNGVTTTFQLNFAPESEIVTSVFIAGVYQQKNTYSLGGVDGDQLVFSQAPPAGANNIEVVVSSIVPADDRLKDLLAAPTGATLIGRGAGTVESALDAIEADLGSLSALDIAYSQDTGIQATTVDGALNFLGRSGKEGLYFTPSTLGHRAGRLVFKIGAGGKVELVTDLRRYFAPGAFVTPTTVESTGLNAYYVKPNGSDVAAGTSWATALASMPAALAKANVDVVFVAAGVYPSGQTLSTYTGTRNVAVHAIGGEAIFITAPATAMTAWDSTGDPTIFRKTSVPTPIGGVAALDHLDDYGMPTILPYLGTDSGALVGTVGWTAFESGGLWSLFIRLPNGSAPVTGRALYYISNNQRVQAPNVKWYQKGITYIGGSAGAFSARGGNINTTVVSEKCKFLGQSTADAYQIKDIGMSICFDCIGADSVNDCFNYHSLSGLTPHFIEVNCIGVRGRAVGSGNGSTAHEDVVGIRLGCDYSFNAGPGIADVNDAQTFNAGCTFPRNTTYGAISQADAMVGPGSLVYLQFCSGGGNPSGDVAARNNGRVLVADCQFSTSLAETGGTIGTF